MFVQPDDPGVNVPKAYEQAIDLREATSADADGITALVSFGESGEKDVADRRTS